MPNSNFYCLKTGGALGKEKTSQPQLMSDATKSNLLIILRGAVGSCPSCGARKLFGSRMRLSGKCPSCKMDFDGPPGHWVGSVGMNTILCVILLLLTIVVSTLLLWPNLKVIPMLLPALIVGFVSPIFLYPISQTLWTAIDLVIRKEK